MVSLGRQVIGMARGPRSSILPSEARETLARVSKTSKVANGVTSKSRLTIVVGIGECIVTCEHRMRAETAGLTGIRLVGRWRMCSVSESSWGPGSTLSIREAGRNGARPSKAGIACNCSSILVGAGTRLGKY